MSEVMTSGQAAPTTKSHEKSPAAQAYELLHFTFIAAPTIAGLDKFFHLLTNWDGYLAPGIANLLPMSAHTFMLIVGVIEIAAGLLVAFRPSVGAYIVAAWLVGIMLNLIMHGGMLDIALRDFGLCLGALALGRLSTMYEEAPRRAAVGVDRS